MDELSRRVFVWQSLLLALVGVGCGGKSESSKHPDTNVVGDALGSFRKLERRVRKQVADERRADAAIALLEQAKANVLRINELLIDWRSEMVRLPPAERGDRARLDAIATRYHAEIVAALRAAAGEAFELREHITADEWARVFVQS